MPYLTPEELPEDDLCRPLSIPHSSEWLAIVSGALTELTKSYNWQQEGAVTVAEAVERMQLMVDSYYASFCNDCTTPGGYRIIRINPDGELEELSPDGDWQEPTGEYVIPPPEAREGGTSADQICLAAKNAVNVLHQLYESLSDSWNGDLDENEAVTAFILALIGLVGFAFAPITAGIVAFMTAVFTALYASLEYIIADLWDDSVDDQFTCFLINCANNDAGVVTFDYSCFINQLNAQQNDFSLTFDQQRLYAQVMYILYFIGGVDGLNLAGSTNEITDDECETCGNWCVTYDLEQGDAGLVDICFVFPSATCGFDWQEGIGVLNGLGPTGAGASRFEITQLDIPSCFIRRVVCVAQAYNMQSTDYVHVRITAPAVSGSPTAFQDGSAGDTDPIGVELIINDSCDTLRFTGASTSSVGGSATGSAALKVITIYGSGDKPSFFDDWSICDPS